MARMAFDRIRYRRHDADVFLYAFDLIELDGEDLRRDPLAVRKATLASLLARSTSGLRFTEHLDEQDGPLVFQHACKLGLEGTVSKRRASFYSSGRSPHWIKTKNPAAPAVKREAEEDWGGWSEKPRHSRRWATSAATAAAIYSSIAARAGAITWDAKGDVRERRRIETRMRKSG